MFNNTSTSRRKFCAMLHRDPCIVGRVKTQTADCRLQTGLTRKIRHVLKPKTTKRNHRNETSETSETAETTETKPPKQPKRPKRAKRNKITETSKTITIIKS